MWGCELMLYAAFCIVMYNWLYLHEIKEMFPLLVSYLLVRLEDGQLLAGRVLEQLLQPAEAVVHDEVHLLLLHVVQHIRQLDDVAVGQPLQQLYLPARQSVIFLTLKAPL